MAPLFSPNGYARFVAGIGRVTCFPLLFRESGDPAYSYLLFVVAARVLCGLKRTIVLNVRRDINP